VTLSGKEGAYFAEGGLVFFLQAVSVSDIKVNFYALHYS
jgi:hypothetical protein